MKENLGLTENINSATINSDFRTRTLAHFKLKSSLDLEQPLEDEDKVVSFLKKNRMFFIESIKENRVFRSWLKTKATIHASWIKAFSNELRELLTKTEFLENAQTDSVPQTGKEVSPDLPLRSVLIEMNTHTGREITPVDISKTKTVAEDSRISIGRGDPLDCFIAGLDLLRMDDTSILLDFLVINQPITEFLRSYLPNCNKIINLWNTDHSHLINNNLSLITAKNEPQKENAQNFHESTINIIIDIIIKNRQFFLTLFFEGIFKKSDSFKKHRELKGNDKDLLSKQIENYECLEDEYIDILTRNLQSVINNPQVLENAPEKNIDTLNKVLVKSIIRICRENGDPQTLRYVFNQYPLIFKFFNDNKIIFFNLKKQWLKGLSSKANDVNNNNNNCTASVKRPASDMIESFADITRILGSKRRNTKSPWPTWELQGEEFEDFDFPQDPSSQLPTRHFDGKNVSLDAGILKDMDIDPSVIDTFFNFDTISSLETRL